MRRQFLCVIQASPHVPPEDILNKLRLILAQRQQGQFNKLRKFGVKTWLNYLASYDMHVAEGRYYAESGTHVYGKPVKQGRSSGKTGWQPVTGCIKAAETGKWPWVGYEFVVTVFSKLQLGILVRLVQPNRSADFGESLLEIGNSAKL